MKSVLKVTTDILLLIVAAFLSAIGLYTFVNPANFAPSGVDGISMMVQKLSGINMGYISLAINIPLLIVAWFFISKKYVVYTSLFTVVSSVAMISDVPSVYVMCNSIINDGLRAKS